MKYNNDLGTKGNILEVLKYLEELEKRLEALEPKKSPPLSVGTNKTIKEKTDKS